MKRIQSIPAARPRKTLARSAVLLALALAAPAPAKTLAPGVLFEVTYAYDSLGRPASRTVNGELQTFEYDGRDRLVAVRAEDGFDIERYRYDAAGNILEKTVRGETTRFVYDAANQLVSCTDGSGTTAFAYDAAGRLVREGDRRFVYGNDGHVSRVLEGGAVVASFDYFLDGQIAAVHARGRTERFLWDGLAMAARGDRTFLNEPASTGGNPVASMGRSFLNDMLGSTVGVHDRKARTRTAVSMTLFGETDADEAYFTGKPELPELGYAFLVRSYRADLGKWQTRDPLGYPDGWNAMAYCANKVSSAADIFGCFLLFELRSKDIVQRPDLIWTESLHTSGGGGWVNLETEYTLATSLAITGAEVGDIGASLVLSVEYSASLTCRERSRASGYPGIPPGMNGQWTEWRTTGELSTLVSYTITFSAVSSNGVDTPKVTAVPTNGSFEDSASSSLGKLLSGITNPVPGLLALDVGQTVNGNIYAETGYQTLVDILLPDMSVSIGATVGGGLSLDILSASRETGISTGSFSVRIFE